MATNRLLMLDSMLEDLKRRKSTSNLKVCFVCVCCVEKRDREKKAEQMSEPREKATARVHEANVFVYILRECMSLKLE